ncbi:uncharacterized protein LOC144040514 [Vanacampus margaritifer]
MWPVIIQSEPNVVYQTRKYTRSSRSGMGVASPWATGLNVPLPQTLIFLVLICNLNTFLRAFEASLLPRTVKFNVTTGRVINLNINSDESQHIQTSSIEFLLSAEAARDQMHKGCLGSRSYKRTWTKIGR